MNTAICLAGDLVAQWRAVSLDATLTDGESVATWTDSVAQLEATANGDPKLATGVVGGRSAVAFDASDGDDGLLVFSQFSPMNGLTDFTVMVSFATSSQDLVGGQGRWFENTGLVDANSLGFSNDWGVSINAAGQVSAGVSGGFASTPISVYSTSAGLNDGQQHTVAFVRSGSTLSLYVDDQPADTVADAHTGALSQNSIGIGQLGTRRNSFSGHIAELRLFNGALDSAEVSAEMDSLNAFYNNQPPSAQPDEYTLEEDAVLFFISDTDGVLANDIDADGDNLTAQLATPPAHGQLTLQPDGSFLYVPESNFFGADSFTYTASDFRAGEPTTVTLNVTPKYDPVVPVAGKL